MKLVSDKDKASSQQTTFDASGSIDTTGFFDDTSQGLDYLTNFLSAPPQMHLDFGEIRFIHRASEDSGYISTANMSIDKDNIVYFEAERVKLELKELKNENEELKLKIARLFAQINEVECNQESLLTENSDLRLKVADLLRQLDVSWEALQQATSRLAEYTAPVVEETTVQEIEPDPEIIVPEETVYDVIELSEELDLHPVEEQSTVPDEPAEPEQPPVEQDVVGSEVTPLEPVIIAVERTPEIPATPAITPREQDASDRVCSGIAPDTAIISRIMAVTAEPEEKRPKAPSVFTSKNTVFSTSTHKTKANPKIIKPEQAKNHHEDPQPVKPPPPPAKAPIEKVTTSPQVEPPKPVFAPPH